MSHRHTPVRLGERDESSFVDSLSEAFAEDPSMGYFFGASNGPEPIRRFMSFLWKKSRVSADERWGVFDGSIMAGCCIVEVPEGHAIVELLRIIRLVPLAIALHAALPSGAARDRRRSIACHNDFVKYGAHRIPDDKYHA